MRKRREAVQGTTAEPGALRRLRGRMSLFAATLGLLVFLGSAQAASAWHLTSISPNKGCPGEVLPATEVVTFTGTGFGAVGTKVNAEWYDPAGLLYTTATSPATTTVANTRATAVVALFLTIETATGTVGIDGSSTKLPFTFTALTSCLGKAGSTGAAGSNGSNGSNGAKGANGSNGANGANGSNGAKEPTEATEPWDQPDQPEQPEATEPTEQTEATE